MNNMKKMICALMLLLSVSTVQQANALIKDLLGLAVIGGVVYYVYKHHYVPRQQAAQNVTITPAPATQDVQSVAAQSPVASTQSSMVPAVQPQAPVMVQIQLPSEAQVQQFIQAAETVIAQQLENVEEVVQELQTTQQVSDETSVPPVQEEVAA